MPFRTAVTELLGVRHPILLAPMGAVAGGRLAAAVTAAGGFGMIGPGYLDEAWVEREFDAAGNARVGIGFITWDLARNPRRLTAALERRPAAVMLSFGDATPFVDEIRDAGARLIMQVQTLADARRAAELGADLIVAQGGEAGGHGASRGTLPLTAAVTEAVAPVPVVAAGGICDGRGLAAALALGAAGVLVGTRFYAARESLGHENAKAGLVAGEGDATVRTTVFDLIRKIDWPKPYTGRAVRNRTIERWHGNEAALLSDVETQSAAYAAAAAKGDLETAVLWAGEGVDLIRDVPAAGEIVERMVAEAEAALKRASGLVTTRETVSP
ncbi:MAG: 2-nitropropane dioxygenase [Alphaproteobacteria bacterium]|nr:MAG: 2-nitropropane dioxygenase [Alphaproteobacteria bacterium]